MLNVTGGLKGIVASIINLINTVLPVLVALALVLFMYGVIQYIYHEGEHKHRDAMLWSLLVLFVMLSFWGILRLVCVSLIGTPSCKL